jgi:DNA-binding MarR family transcriptional regulator
MSTGLQADLKQTKPFRSREEEAFLNLIRTASALEHAQAEGLKEFGVTLTQYNVLRILAGAGPSGLCRNEVRDRMVTPVPDATRLLDRLEAAGYVKRTREGEDRRFVTAHITEAGQELLDRMAEPVAEHLRRNLGHMSEAELREFSSLLQKARAER